MKRVSKRAPGGGQGPQGANGLSPAYDELNLSEQDTDSIEMTTRN